jgi:hypothetical protein
VLLATDRYGEYMRLLRDNFCAANLDGLMCRNLLSVDWQGYLYDCDFNQMLGLPLGAVEGRADARPLHIRDLLTGASLEGRPIATGEHCYGCAAGQGSSCGGALEG